jgi:hypothetical protein
MRADCFWRSKPEEFQFAIYHGPARSCFRRFTMNNRCF